jgi:hypothetical protein
VLKRQGLSLGSLGSNGSSARAVEQRVLHQLRLRRWRWQMERSPSKTKRNSERDLGRLGLPARTGSACRPGTARLAGPDLGRLGLPARRWQMERLPSKTNRNSERDLGRLGLPARTGPEARLQGAGDQPAIRKPFLPPSRRWLSGG